jgi:hypothetical protein
VIFAKVARIDSPWTGIETESEGVGRGLERRVRKFGIDVRGMKAFQG